MNDLTISVTGWVATDPSFVITRDGDGPPLCTFRLAQTSRYFDRNAGEWADRKTEWFSVRVFRDAAFSVAESISKGQPVIVAGRLRTNEWIDSKDQARVDLQLDAFAVGHDLTRGIAKFTRVTVTDSNESEEVTAPDAAEVTEAANDKQVSEAAQIADLEDREGALA